MCYHAKPMALRSRLLFRRPVFRRMDVAVSTHQASKTDRPLPTSAAAGWLLLAAAVAALVVALDMLTKWLIEREIGPAASRTHISILGSFLELRYALNDGVAFGQK